MLSPDPPPGPRLEWCGEAALLVEFGDGLRPDLAANARVHAMLAALDAAPPPGLRGLTPAYTSLLAQVDPLAATREAVERHVRAVLAGIAQEPSASRPAGRTRVIPVVYGGEHGPDLDDVAALTGLAAEDVVALHIAAEQVVYMLGFSPGYPYLGDLPEALAVPRLTTPRERVPAGSVAIAGRQTGVYPRETPGGWRLIGRTPITLFDPARDPPAYLAPGDRVRFQPIAADAWDAHAGRPADW